MSDDLSMVIAAAERYANELLGQAGNYEKLGQQSTADLTMDEHYYPPRDAIDRVAGRPASTPRKRQVKRALRNGL